MSLSGNTEKITELLSKINALPEETTPSYQEKTVTPSTSAQTVTPDSGYDALSKVTVNAMPTATQATPSITVSSAGLITAKATQTAGYVAAGTKSATKQLTVQAAQTITPGTADKTIASGRYLTGTQTIKGDSNLVADNIKSGVSIFGVTGSYEGSGGSGGGSGAASVETCEVTFKLISMGRSVTRNVLYQEVLADGTTQTVHNTVTCTKAGSGTVTFMTNKGALIVYHYDGEALDSTGAPNSATTNAELAISSSYYRVYAVGQSDTATIKVYP